MNLFRSHESLLAQAMKEDELHLAKRAYDFLKPNRILASDELRQGKSNQV